MKHEERLRQLEGEFQKFNSKREALKRQIAFQKEWISNLQSRLDKAKESSDYTWHSAVRSHTDILNNLEARLESEKKSLASSESEYSQVSKKTELLERKFKAEQSKEFAFGFRLIEIADLRGGGGGLSTHSSEMKALKIIAEEDGSTNARVISHKMAITPEYTRLLCMSLRKADYVDTTDSGELKVTPKGEKELEKKGVMPWL